MLNNHDYNVLTREDSFLYAENSAELLDALKKDENLVICIYPYSEKGYVEFALIEKDSNPNNIDVWETDKIEDITDRYEIR